MSNKLSDTILSTLKTDDLIMQTDYHQELLFNNHKQGIKVIKALQDSLLTCDHFKICVAFISEGGLTLILQQLETLSQRGIRGEILTSTFQLFNSPKVFKRLLNLSNVTVRVNTENNLHIKAYLFSSKEKKTFIIGSSNLTQSALTTNNEWNIKTTGTTDEKILLQIQEEYNMLWDQSSQLNETWIETYEKHYNKYHLQMRAMDFKPTDLAIRTVVPNSMQQKALASLRNIRLEKKKKALLVSATGTGKTYLACFDVKQSGYKKILFIVHREQIARDAEKTFKKTIPSLSTGLISGSSKHTGADITFATIQTLHKDTVLHSFKPDAFNYIIIDEAHRSGSPSYQKILQYFKPQFLLGMTATPERTDDFNVFELFDFTLAHEIRLQDALEDDLLTPFHYFGVTDVKVDGKEIDDQSTLSQLLNENRIDYIIGKMNYFGYSGTRVQGLIFCSTKDEAFQLSEQLNNRGLRTLALTGSNTQDERMHAIDRLTSLNGDLDYIITVDIFNEGIDIPSINQIVMLRPTQSAIIFVQQLGRGLRKHKDKDFVVIIDFIANYKNNFLIPIALSGDKSMSKDKLKEFMLERNAIIPGSSSIEFDEIARERIYTAIDTGKISGMKNLIKEYTNLKNKLGKIPQLIDFYQFNSLSPEVLFEQKGCSNYYEFLKIAEPDLPDSLSKDESSLLSFISRELSNSMRIVEINIIEALIENISLNDFSSLLGQHSEIHLTSAINMLSGNFLTNTERIRYDNCFVLNTDISETEASHEFQIALQNLKFRDHLLEVIHYIKTRFLDEFYKQTNPIGLKLYNRYTRKQVSWLLNWKSNEQGTIFGYKFNEYSNTIPIFVTYTKDDGIQDTIKYHDYFINQQTFHWMSKSRRTLSSPEILKIIDAENNNTQMPLFIKRNDGEDKYFYFVGMVSVNTFSQSQLKNKDQSVPVVSFTFDVHPPVRHDIYDYLTSELI